MKPGCVSGIQPAAGRSGRLQITGWSLNGCDHTTVPDGLSNLATAAPFLDSWAATYIMRPALETTGAFGNQELTNGDEPKA